MFKLLVTLGVFLFVALTVFGLRQQQREISAQCVTIYHEIDNRRDTLRSQRVEIGRETCPTALASGLKAAGIDPGDALLYRDGRTGKPRPAARVTPQVETDLVAPVRDSDGSGHSNPNRQQQ